jgi:hypothetical protein
VDWKVDLRGREALKAERPMIEDILPMNLEKLEGLEGN